MVTECHLRHGFPPPPSAISRSPEGVETSTEAYFTQQINALVAARDLERNKLRREHQEKERLGSQDERKRIGVDKDMGREKMGKGRMEMEG